MIVVALENVTLWVMAGKLPVTVIDVPKTFKVIVLPGVAFA